MEDINNPKAFPRPWSKIKQHPSAPEQISVAQSGMTLRDYFAAKALNGIHSSDVMWTNMMLDRKEKDPFEYVAQECYKMADAMLKERTKTQES